MEEKDLNFDNFDDISMIAKKDANNEDYIEENLCVLSVDNVMDLEINKDKFLEGVNDVSYLCGAISALVSVGINPNKAMDYLTDKEATELGMKHNIDISNIQKETAVETAKFNFISNSDYRM